MAAGDPGPLAGQADVLEFLGQGEHAQPGFDKLLSGAHGHSSGRRSGLRRLTSTPGEPWAPLLLLAADCPEILNYVHLREVAIPVDPKTRGGTKE